MDPGNQDSSTKDFSGIKTGSMTWLKGERIKLSPNLSTVEFSCQCSYPSCTTQTIAAELITKLQLIRDELKEPITITSGFRCSKRQADLNEPGSGVETVVLSQHCFGNAADFTTHALKKAEELANTYFDAVGVSPRFIHVDLRHDKKRRWTYTR